MKRNVKYIKNKYGFNYIKYEDKVVKMEVYKDGSGFLGVDGINFYSGEGTHKNRIKELENLARVINKALKVLEQIEDPKIYFPKAVK